MSCCLEGHQKVRLCGIHHDGLRPKSWNARILALSGKVLGPLGLKQNAIQEMAFCITVPAPQKFLVQLSLPDDWTTRRS